jgi:hypothetical protein
MLIERVPPADHGDEDVAIRLSRRATIFLVSSKHVGWVSIRTIIACLWGTDLVGEGVPQDKLLDVVV